MRVGQEVKLIRLTISSREPFVGFLSIQQLTTTNRIPMNLRYSSLRIYHYMDLRNKISKELVHTPSICSEKELEEFFINKRQDWEASKSCATLKSILEMVNPQHKVTKVIGLACGSMAIKSDDRNAQRSAYQHALILTVRDIFQRHLQLNNIPCYAQDLIYSPVDTAVLLQHGTQTLKNPKAFSEIDDETILFTCAPNIPIKQIVAEIALPPVIIWDKVIGEEVPGKWYCLVFSFKYPH
jgi:hypothetical protein